MASKLGIVQVHADAAAVRTELLEKVAADGGFDFHGAMRENFLSLRFTRTAKVEKSQRLDFCPGGLAKRVQIALDGLRHRVISHAEHVLDAVRWLPRAAASAGTAKATRKRSPGCSMRSMGMPRATGAAR